MRNLISGLMVMILVTMAFGCASSSAPTDKATETKAAVLQSGGHDVLHLTVPTDTRLTPTDGSLGLLSDHRKFDVWLVPGTQTVAEAVGHINPLIKEEFKEFKATTTRDITIAGTPAKWLEGSGTEADDGDAGYADIAIFKIGNHVFIACTHGEGISPEAEQWMLAVLQTAQVP